MAVLMVVGAGGRCSGTCRWERAKTWVTRQSPCECSRDLRRGAWRLEGQIMVKI